ncbi:MULTISPECIES: SEL1-like repeat protein [Olivibacter]|jgi:TPR repeat protein|uniref:SEL1-like repeat protein n=1 Tax=Olivibacter oleidegradans TaxID=760123 RepID=A0ABV6HI17_9SPHI|nr:MULTISPECIES: SEL1-like repeat protein [Olivibacter]MDM8174601.1 SEL1-like repeat protein [Olivibacter sp. 47]QEL01406.1 sel1 repeat family protein [Olivibacter sp. LS-1]
MTLEQQYSTILNNISQNSLNPKVYDRSSLHHQKTWFEGLATLEIAVHNLPQQKQEVVDLYEELFSEGLDFKASYELDEMDYAFYWDKILAILSALAIHHTEVYAQIAFQYNETRRMYRNNAKFHYYLNLAIETNVPVAKAVAAYFYYYGINTEKDKERASQLFREDSGDWSVLYQAYIQLNEKQFEFLPAVIEQLKSSSDKKIKKNALILEGSYLEAIGKPEEALSVFEQSYKSDYSAFSLTRVAFIKHMLDNTHKEASMKLWKEAASLGSIEAMNYLGVNTFPEVYTQEAYTETVRWFSLGYLYNNAYAAYRLALIRLYVEGWEEKAIGFRLLEEAIEGGSLDALIEKAEIYTEGRIIERDEKMAFELFQKAAKEKDAPYAYVRLGYLYEIGAGPDGEKDAITALDMYEKAVEKDHPYGYSNAGRMYRYGIAGEINIEKAKAYFEKGVEQNIPFSITELAFMYEDGTLAQDYKKAFELFGKAAEGNSAYAMYCYGQYLQNGYNDGEKAPEQAFYWFQKGAELQEVNCIYETGRCYRYGLGVEENPDQALYYYQQAADAGYPRGLVELALCYEYEYGVNFDAEKVLNLMIKAAEQGYAFAQYKVGVYYMHGSLGEQVPINSEQAIMWLNKAADAGYPYAYVELGDYYLWDYDNLNEADRAFAFYEKASEQDVIAEGLGVCYEYGIGIDYSMSEAFKYYEMAANKNVIGAMYRLGNCYLNGNGVSEQPEEAYKWFFNAAQQGNVPSQYLLGKLLLKGKGVAMNKEEGIEWLQKAAEQQYAAAQYELGNCYLMGDGLEENEDNAMYWFEQAAEKGHERAIKIVGGNRR